MELALFELNGHSYQINELRSQFKLLCRPIKLSKDKSITFETQNSLKSKFSVLYFLLLVVKFSKTLQKLVIKLIHLEWRILLDDRDKPLKLRIKQLLFFFQVRFSYKFTF